MICVLVGSVLLFFHLRERLKEVNWNGNTSVLQTRIALPKHRQVAAAIRKRDPTFDKADFTRLFERAFRQIQQAWSNQDMAAVQHFVSDGICEKFAVQFREQQRLGYRNRMDKVSVRSMRFAHFASRDLFDVLTVEVEAAAVDQRIALSDGALISGSAEPQVFVEFWSFVRRGGALTEQAQGSLMAGQCPSCGGDIELNQFGKCTVCDSLSRSGNFDWVLAEITQANAWSAPDLNAARAAASYRREHDPQFNIPQLENRASVIFARLTLAKIAAATAPLRKLATDAYCEASAVTTANSFWTNSSPDSLEFIGVVIEPDRHLALLDIRWQGQKFNRSDTMELKQTERWRTMRSLMVLSRRGNVQTDRSRGLQATYCPSCGAPETDLETDACPYCQTVTNTGQYDWVLSAFVANESNAAAAWRKQVSATPMSIAEILAAARSETSIPTRDLGFGGDTPTERTGLEQPTRLCDLDCLIWAIGNLAQDGEMDDSERQYLQDMATRQQIAQPLVSCWIDDALAGNLKYRQTSDPESREQYLTRLVDVALTDGQLRRNERRLLAGLSDRLQFSSSEFNQMVRRCWFNKHKCTVTTDQSTVET